MVRGAPRPENVTDFKRLQPAMFSRIKSPLNVEQWLIDTIDLLKTAQVWNENQVEVTKIQKRCSKNLVVGRRNETREAHYLGSILEKFLRKVLWEDGIKRDGRIIYQMQQKDRTVASMMLSFYNLVGSHHTWWPMRKIEQVDSSKAWE